MSVSGLNLASLCITSNPEPTDTNYAYPHVIVNINQTSIVVDLKFARRQPRNVFHRARRVCKTKQTKFRGRIREE